MHTNLPFFRHFENWKYSVRRESKKWQEIQKGSFESFRNLVLLNTQNLQSVRSQTDPDGKENAVLVYFKTLGARGVSRARTWSQSAVELSAALDFHVAGVTTEK